MSSAAELEMRLYEFRRQQELRQGGGMVLRDVLSRDNPHHSPDYDAQDPFYAGPNVMGGSALRFADIARPDLGEIVVA